MPDPTTLYQPAKTVYQEGIVLKSALRSTSGVSDTVLLLPEIKFLKFLLDVTATAGVPTLDVALEEAWDFGDRDSIIWKSLGTFTQRTTAGNDVFQIPTNTVFTRKVRANYSIGGTGGPSFTFSMDFFGKG